MPIDPTTLSSLAHDYARPMTSIRGRRVQRLLKREFAGAQYVLSAQVGVGTAAVLGLSASGAALCATDGKGKEARVVKWNHGSGVALEERFDLHKDSLPLLGTSSVALASLRAQAPLQVRADSAPPEARALLAKALQVLAVGLPGSPLADLHTIELGAGSEPLLQRFFDANPAYFLSIQGEPAGPDEAHEEIHGELPAGWSFTKQWVIGCADATGELAAMANLVSDLLAPGVWHIGTFIVATSRHGTGEAQTLYRGLERWMRDSGAQWLRLGVVASHTRAHRFWQSQGFEQVRTREGMRFGALTQTVLVMFKPLAHGTLEEYLSLVPRDRPEPTSNAS